MTVTGPTQPKFVGIQAALIKILSDGRPHSRGELLAVMDPMSSLDNLRGNITILRNKLRPMGQDIICQYIRMGLYYRHVRLLYPLDED